MHKKCHKYHKWHIKNIKNNINNALKIWFKYGYYKWMLKIHHDEAILIPNRKKFIFYSLKIRLDGNILLL